MFLIAFCTAESTQTLQEKHWQAKAIPAMVQTVITKGIVFPLLCMSDLFMLWSLHQMENAQQDFA